MMLSRLATKLNRIVHAQTKYSAAQIVGYSSGGRTADPEEHAVEPEDSYPEERPRGTPTKEQPPIKQNDPFVSPNPPHSPSPKIESNAVNQPIDPINQQRRKYASSSGAVAAESLKDVDCAGMDGTPWPEDEIDRRSQIRERVDVDKEYYEHHKASPLSEMEMADTRKPITRATDGTGGGGGGYFGGSEGVILWSPEQLDTAEEALLRAKRIWEENAMRGDPDSPHGRVLRALRGENW